MQKNTSIAKNLFSENLFWDIDLKQLDMDLNKRFIIQRVLEYGTLSDWHVIKKYYGITAIGYEMQKTRSLDKTALSFISMVTNTRKEDFQCYTLIQSPHQHWTF